VRIFEFVFCDFNICAIAVHISQLIELPLRRGHLAVTWNLATSAVIDFFIYCNSRFGAVPNWYSNISSRCNPLSWCSTAVVLQNTCMPSCVVVPLTLTSPSFSSSADILRGVVTVPPVYGILIYICG
jgi:hypothetical protein